MANEQTLFEKLLDPDRKIPRSATARKQMMTESVVRHLTLLLNSREECCRILHDYGMPDLENRAGSRIELKQELEGVIRNTITKYERRLKNVQVHLDVGEDEALVPKFRVTADLNCRDDFSKDVSFTTIVDPVGQIHIA